MKVRKLKLSGLMLMLGILLLAGAAVLLAVNFFSGSGQSLDLRQTVGKLRVVMPDTRDAVPDDRVNMQMPAMEIDGFSFCGILQVPVTRTELPILERWDEDLSAQVPYRYTGSIYDRTLVIGGSGKAGQLDFVREITVGDALLLTDMTGGRYTYTVSLMETVGDVSKAYLTSVDADLVLFADNGLSSGYTVVGCKLK